MRSKQLGPCYALLLVLLLGTSCAGGSKVPHLLNQGQKLNDSRDCAQAVFEVRVSPNGTAKLEDLYLVGLDPPQTSGEAVRAMRQAALQQRWAPAETKHGVGLEARSFLMVDCDGRAAEVGRHVPSEVEDALKIRDRAAKELKKRRKNIGETRFPAAEEFEVVWTDVATFTRRGPFLYDDIRRWSEIQWKLRDAEANSKGFWVAHLRRTTHTGEFVFFDKRKKVIDVTVYLIGE
jgi:hypothetical protein